MDRASRTSATKLKKQQSEVGSKPSAKKKAGVRKSTTGVPTAASKSGGSGNVAAAAAAAAATAATTGPVATISVPEEAEGAATMALLGTSTDAEAGKPGLRQAQLPPGQTAGQFNGADADVRGQSGMAGEETGTFAMRRRASSDIAIGGLDAPHRKSGYFDLVFKMVAAFKGSKNKAAKLGPTLSLKRGGTKKKGELVLENHGEEDDGSWSVGSLDSFEVEEYHAPELEELIEQSEKNLMLRAATKVDAEGTPFWRSLLTSTADLGSLGVGVKLYFVMLKYIGMLFLILLAVTAPNMYIFSWGSMVDEPEWLKQFLGQLSIVNLGKCPTTGCLSRDDVESRCLFSSTASEDCSWKVRSVAEVIGDIDGLALMTYILFGIFLASIVIPMHSSSKRVTDRVAAYTAMVYELPAYLDGERAQRNLLWGVHKDHRVLLDDLRRPGGAWKDLGLVVSGGTMPEEGGGPEKLEYIAVWKDMLYGVGQDSCVYRTVYRRSTSSWERVTAPGVSCIGIYESHIYGLGPDKAVYRQQLETLSPDFEWEKVSQPGILCFTLHEGKIFGAGADGCIMALHVDLLSMETPWLRWQPGDLVVKFCGCCRRQRTTEGLQIRSLAIAGGKLLAVGADRKLYSQRLDDVQLERRAWKLESESETLSSICVNKERSQRHYAHELGRHMREVLMAMERREKSTRWKPNMARTTSNRTEAKEPAKPQAESRSSIFSFGDSKTLGGRIKEKGLLLQKMVWRSNNRHLDGPSAYEADIILDRRDDGELGFSWDHLEESLLICGAEVDVSGGTMAIRKHDTNIIRGSLLAKWNAANPQRQVLPGHRIVEVNGLENNPKLMAQELREKAVLAIKVDKAVREVVLVRDNGSTVQHFMTRGKLQQSIDNMRVRLQYACQEEDDKRIRQLSKQVQYLCGKADRLMKKLKFQAQLKDECKEVCLAFVTFSSQEIRQKILSEYRYSAYSYWRPIQDPTLRFFGTPLMVVQAPDAGDLFWENLDYSRRLRTMRKVFIGVVTVFVLCVCSFLIAIGMSAGSSNASSLQKNIWIVENGEDSTAKCLKFCDWELYSSTRCAAGSGSDDDWDVVRHFDLAQDYIGGFDFQGDCTANVWSSVGCSTGLGQRDWFGVEFGTNRTVGCMRMLQELSVTATSLRFYACDSVPELGKRSGWYPNQTCIKMEAVEPDVTTEESDLQGYPSGNLGIVQDTYCAVGDDSQAIAFETALAAKEADPDNYEDPTLSCYCLQQTSSSASFLIPPYDSAEQQLCSDWIYEKTAAITRIVLGVVAVVLVNQLLLLIYTEMIHAEKHFTQTEIAVSSFRKIFWSMFVNTSLLTYFVNARISGLDGEFFSMVSLGQGNYYEPNEDWYLVVGISMCITIFLLPLTNTLPQILFVFLERSCCLPYVMSQAVTQAWADENYLLPAWNLPIRLAQTMNSVVVIMMFAPGLPFLYLVGGVYCFAAFWADKWMLLRGSSRPPVYAKAVIEAVMEVWALGAFMHALFGATTYSNQSLLPSDWSPKLLEWMEWWVSRDLSDYEDAIATWNSAYTTEEKELAYWEFIRARFMDCARVGCWPLTMIMVFYFVYFLVTQVYINLFRPILKPFLAVIQHKLAVRLANNCVARAIEACVRCMTNGIVTDPLGIRGQNLRDIPPLYKQIQKMEAEGYLTSYRMDVNPKYKLAAAAVLQYQEEAAQENDWEGGMIRRHRDLRRREKRSINERMQKMFVRLAEVDVYGRSRREMYKGPKVKRAGKHDVKKFLIKQQANLARQAQAF